MNFGACSAVTMVSHGFKEADLLGCLKDAGAANLCGETLLGKLSTRWTEALGSSASGLGKKRDTSLMCSKAALSTSCLARNFDRLAKSCASS